MLFDDLQPKPEDMEAQWELLGHNHERVNASVKDGFLQVDKGGVKFSMELTDEQARPVIDLLTYLLHEKFTAPEIEMMRDVVAQQFLFVMGR